MSSFEARETPSLTTALTAFSFSCWNTWQEAAEGRRGSFWLIVWRINSFMGKEGLATGASQQWSHCAPRQESEREQEVGPGYNITRPTRNDPLPLSKTPPPKSSTGFQNSAIIWRPSFQTYEPLGDIFPSNHNSCNAEGQRNIKLYLRAFFPVPDYALPPIHCPTFLYAQ